MPRHSFKIFAFRALLVAALCVAMPLSAEEVTRARLVFIGDIMNHAHQIEAARRDAASFDFTPQFRRVIPLFYEALVVGNLETVFGGEASGYTGYPEFNTPDELADAIAGAGIHVLTFSNNHTLDRGEAGAVRTTEVLDRAGLLWTGIATDATRRNEPLLIEHEGFKIALLNYTYGTNHQPRTNTPISTVWLNVISDDAIIDGLAKAKKLSPDLIVVCPHWGNEYQFAPTARDRATAELMLAHGADLIVGTHPHVLQPIEIRTAEPHSASDDVHAPKMIAWSLGNFVSYQRTLPRERSAVLAIDVERGGDGVTRIVRVSVAPTWVSATHRLGRPRIEVVYGGTGGPFNHEGIVPVELKKARAAGARVLEFLGVSASTVSPDEGGFYTLWDAASPDGLPTSGRRSPE